MVFEADRAIGAFSTEARAKAYVSEYANNDVVYEVRAMMIDELPKIESVSYRMGA
jgi:hypothetical protein